jgi:hypothetical protein
MTETTIDRLFEDEVPLAELDDAAWFENQVASRCCNVLPCLNPEGCPR